jgi:hypothetical protein
MSKKIHAQKSHQIGKRPFELRLKLEEAKNQYSKFLKLGQAGLIVFPSLQRPSDAGEGVGVVEREQIV